MAKIGSGVLCVLQERGERKERSNKEKERVSRETRMGELRRRDHSSDSGTSSMYLAYIYLRLSADERVGREKSNRQ